MDKISRCYKCSQIETLEKASNEEIPCIRDLYSRVYTCSSFDVQNEVQINPIFSILPSSSAKSRHQ